MKDSEGIEIQQCDLVLVTIDTPTREVADLFIFIEMEDRVTSITEDGEEREVVTRFMRYYPLTPEGLEVANSDKDIENTSFHRQKKFVISNIESKHLLVRDPNLLNGYKKELYDSINTSCQLVVATSIIPSIIVLPSITSIGSKPPSYACSEGVWEGTTPITYTYKWRADEVEISGETGNTFVDNDSFYVGQTISCCVTATNSRGSTTQCVNA